jgi:protein arginine kinase
MRGIYRGVLRTTKTLRSMMESAVDKVAERGVHWLADGGSDVVVSSRVRLARNLNNCRFPASARRGERREILDRVTGAFEALPNVKDGDVLQMTALDEISRRILFERHLISREHCGALDGGVYVSSCQSCSIMVNEEDHLRLQLLLPGLQLGVAWEELNYIDSLLSQQLDFAYDPSLGFLTACPSNVGTGMRASVMMHLPGLALSDELDRVVAAVSKLGYTVRGVFGEGTEITGNLLQLSNQSTLGESELQIIDDLTRVIDEIAMHEKNARAVLLERRPYVVLDYVGRAYGLLKHAHKVESREATEHVAALRLGVELGLFGKLTRGRINELWMATQPGHLQWAHQRNLTEDERDVARAELLRKSLIK